MRSGVSIKVRRKCLHITEPPLDCSSSSSGSSPADGLKGVKVREGSGTITGKSLLRDPCAILCPLFCVSGECARPGAENHSAAAKVLFVDHQHASISNQCSITAKRCVWMLINAQQYSDQTAIRNQLSVVAIDLTSRTDIDVGSTKANTHCFISQVIPQAPATVRSNDMRIVEVFLCIVLTCVPHCQRADRESQRLDDEHNAQRVKEHRSQRRPNRANRRSNVGLAFVT
ncbi:hypothetical protein EXN66_Car020649 [Channa argus]|uniref:Uncharacterized protein n=1 Tax=Channa argus TaxID=215402 RepID=A0A6G1QRW2_CHAAH|nr:hypothetical protein EXN66_Car020649 [Channa argus]